MRRFFAVLLVIATVRSASGQGSQASIDPGMTREQVIGRLGRPAAEHSRGTSTYIFYRNGQEKKMGMSDLVALEDGKVVDAVFRSSARRYTGKSSSPAPISADAAIAKGNGGKMPLRAPLKRQIPPSKTTPAPGKTPSTPAKKP